MRYSELGMDPVEAMITLQFAYEASRPDSPSAADRGMNTEERISIHEAGHVLISKRYGIPVEKVGL